MVAAHRSRGPGPNLCGGAGEHEFPEKAAPASACPRAFLCMFPPTDSPGPRWMMKNLRSGRRRAHAAMGWRGLSPAANRRRPRGRAVCACDGGANGWLFSRRAGGLEARRRPEIPGDPALRTRTLEGAFLCRAADRRHPGHESDVQRALQGLLVAAPVTATGARRTASPMQPMWMKAGAPRSDV